MSLTAIKLRVAPNRGRVMVQIGRCIVELTPDDVSELQVMLHRAAAQVSYSPCDPELRGEPCDGHALKDPVVGWRTIERLFAHLEVAAKLGLPCPTNAELADRLRVSKPEIVVDLVRKLEGDGRIAVERFANSRVVTICKTGQQTARPLQVTVHWREAQARAAAAA